MKKKFNVDGMVCASCQATVKHAVETIDGVKSADVSLINNTMIVDYSPKKVDENIIISAVQKSGYDASIYEEEPYQMMLNKRNNELKKKKINLIITLAFVILLMIFAMGPMIAMECGGVFITNNPFILIPIQLVLLIPILVLNFNYFTSGTKALISLHPNMDSLISIGSLAAIIYGLYVFIKIIVLQVQDPFSNMEEIHKLGMNLYLESAGTILGLVSLGKYLESKSINSALNAIGKMMKLIPETAFVMIDGIEIKTKIKDIKIGDIISVKPGDRIPLDGVIISGNGDIDESSITGESVQVFKKKDSNVISGTLNTNGSFLFKVTKIGKDTTLNKIVELVSQASDSKTKITQLVDQVSLYFVPVVIILSIITFVVWASIPPNDISLAFNFAISVLVISCPCSLGLATPIASLVGAKLGAENGILIKSNQDFYELNNVDCIVFDKTGTITTGKMTVQSINIPKDDLDHLLSLESNSNHPISKALVEYLNNQNINGNDNLVSFEYKPGLGLQAIIDGHIYKSGNIKFINPILKKEEKKLIDSLLNKGQTIIYVSKDDEYIGYYSVSDTIKESSKNAIEILKKKGKRIILLTGDNAKSASYFGSLVGIDEIISEVKPEDKLNVISNLQKEGLKVAMVGDGINDSPSLIKSDVGIAIGAGSDIAIDSASIILIKSDLMDVVKSMELSKKVKNKIKTNLFWAFFYNSIAIPFAAGILYFPPIYFALNPMIASLCMALSSITVVLNSLLLNLVNFANFKKIS